ncbi:ATP12 family chaperone protein [Aquicoccus sp.]|uniref:ATP12 family chaperone protein n=1 Tax=Aquicoccus sp. TaxID=2055851 RepID=UPI0035631F7F
MSEWKARRFWKEAIIAPEAEASEFGILLDGRPVRSPAKAPLVLPTEKLAQAVAAEWNAQGEVIDPQTMPFTRSANAAIDKVRAQHDEVAAMIAAYGDSDLLCYRAEAPEELVARQAAAWNPMLDWIKARHDIALSPVNGVMYEPQDLDSIVKIQGITKSMNAFELTGFHDLVGLSGSFVLGLAAAERVKPAQELWALSRVDETWQCEQWGRDLEAEEASAMKERAFSHAMRFFEFSRTDIAVV